MKAIYASRALRDVDEILAYLQQRSPQGAHRVSIAIEAAVDRCALTPLGGPATDEPGLRRRPLGRYPYTIFYRVDVARDVVEIVRVVHGARVKSLGQLPSEEDSD